MRKANNLISAMKGVYNEWVYNRLEGTSDSVIDFDIDKTAHEARDTIRIRNIRNVASDRSWHAFKIGENFEIALNIVYFAP